MQLAMIGLGRMGANMTERLAAGGHRLVVYDVDAERSRSVGGGRRDVVAAMDMQSLLRELKPPRALWLMIPHQFVDDTLRALTDQGLAPGDLVVDGGNSNYRESVRRADELAASGILFADCGTSGGVWGLEEGYSLMVGGSDEAVARIEPALKTLAPAPDRGWGHVGPAGAGHFVKMVHNGIEYGMMQAYAEGFELMAAKTGMGLDLRRIARIWQHGSVVRSWLLDLTADALERDPGLEALSDWVEDSGEGRWTVQEAVDSAVPTPVITLALMMRFRSRQDSSFAGRLLAAMRAGFGGHRTHGTAEGDPT